MLVAGLWCVAGCLVCLPAPFPDLVFVLKAHPSTVVVCFALVSLTAPTAGVFFGGTAWGVRADAGAYRGVC